MDDWVRSEEEGDGESHRLSKVRKASQVLAAMKLVAELGGIRSDERYKKLPGTDGCYEFRPRKFSGGQLRVLCFQDGNKVICSHPVTKKRGDLPKADVDKVKAVRNEYFEGKKNGTLEHEEKSNGENFRIAD